MKEYILWIKLVFYLEFLGFIIFLRFGIQY